MNHALENTIQQLRSLFMKNERLSLASMGAAMGLMIVGMGVFSLAVLNTKATKGYQLNELETRRQELITELEINDTLILRAQSMNTIQEETSHMVKADSESIYYVVPASAVAVNDR